MDDVDMPYVDELSKKSVRDQCRRLAEQGCFEEAWEMANNPNYSDANLAAMLMAYESGVKPDEDEVDNNAENDALPPKSEPLTDQQGTCDPVHDSALATRSGDQSELRSVEATSQLLCQVRLTQELEIIDPPFVLMVKRFPADTPAHIVKSQVRNFQIKAIDPLTRKFLKHLPRPEAAKSLEELRGCGLANTVTKFDYYEDLQHRNYILRMAASRHGGRLDDFPFLLTMDEDLSQPAIMQHFVDQRYLDERFSQYVGDRKEQLDDATLNFWQQHEIHIQSADQLEDPPVHRARLVGTMAVIRDMDNWPFLEAPKSRPHKHVRKIIDALKQRRGPDPMLASHILLLGYPARKRRDVRQKNEASVIDENMPSLPPPSDEDADIRRRMQARFPNLPIMHHRINGFSGDAPYYVPGDGVVDVQDYSTRDIDPKYYTSIFQYQVPGSYDWSLLSGTSYAQFFYDQFHWSCPEAAQRQLPRDSSLHSYDVATQSTLKRPLEVLDEEQQTEMIPHWNPIRSGQVIEYGYTPLNHADLIHRDRIDSLSRVPSKAKRQRLTSSDAANSNALVASKPIEVIPEQHRHSSSGDFDLRRSMPYLPPPEETAQPASRAAWMPTQLLDDVPGFFIERKGEDGFLVTNADSNSQFIVSSTRPPQKYIQVKDLVESLNNAFSESVNGFFDSIEDKKVKKSLVAMFEAKGLGPLMPLLFNKEGSVRMKGETQSGLPSNMNVKIAKDRLKVQLQGLKAIREAASREEGRIEPLWIRYGELAQARKGSKALNDQEEVLMEHTLQHTPFDSAFIAAAGDGAGQDLAALVQSQLLRLRQQEEYLRLKYSTKGKLLEGRLCEMELTSNLMLTLFAYIKNEIQADLLERPAPPHYVWKTAELMARLQSRSGSSASTATVRNSGYASMEPSSESTLSVIDPLNGTLRGEGSAISQVHESCETGSSEVEMQDAINNPTETPQRRASTNPRVNQTLQAEASSATTNIANELQGPRSHEARQSDLSTETWKHPFPPFDVGEHYLRYDAATNPQAMIGEHLTLMSSFGVTSTMLSDIQAYYHSQKPSVAENGHWILDEGGSRVYEENKVCKGYRKLQYDAETWLGLRGGPQALERERMLNPFHDDALYTREERIKLGNRRLASTTLNDFSLSTECIVSKHLSKLSPHESPEHEDAWQNWERAAEAEDKRAAQMLRDNFEITLDGQELDEAHVREHMEALRIADLSSGKQVLTHEQYAEKATDQLRVRHYKPKHHYKDKMLNLFGCIPPAVSEVLCNMAEWTRFSLDYPMEKRVIKLEQWEATGRESWRAKCWLEAQRPMKQRIMEVREIQKSYLTDENCLPIESTTNYAGDFHPVLAPKGKATES